MNDLTKHIEKIFDENNDEIQFSTLEIKYEKTYRSSVLSKILYVDNCPITGKLRNLYKVKFKCNCGNCSTVALKYFLSKNIVQCNKCDQSKRIKQKNEVQRINFDEYSIEFQTKYWERHLHNYEFDLCIDKVKTINHKTFKKENIVYYEHLSSNNQSKFQSYISFDNGLTKEPLKSLEFNCNICGNEVSIHPFNIRRQDLNNLICRHCKFNNLTFPIRKYNDSLTYQSLPELKFIELCIENDIQILNGFEIPYYFNKKDRTYVTDFYLPEFKYIIEIKSMNPYYKDDLSSGKVEAKGAAAVNFGKQYGMKYKLVFDYDVENFINILKETHSLTIL